MGADLLVRGAVALARRTRVSPMVVAFSVVAFGTSLPELVVTLRASLAGFPGLVLGNVVGSNTANVLLVGGLSAIVYPLAASGESVKRDAVVMTVATLVFALMCLSGELGRVDGVILLVGFAVVLTMMARETLTAQREADTTTPLEWVLGLPSKLGMIVLFLVLGIAALPVGANLLVEAAVEIAANLGVSETVIGLTLVAIGTSMPELATTFMAALQKRTDVAIGTIVGSNTFNIVAIMGLGAALSPRSLEISRRFLILDLPVMLVAGLAMALFALRRRSLGRAPGILFVAAYLAYLGVLLSTA
jgi:cation:H+ antiporter